MPHTNLQKYIAELIGTGFLLATIVGSGIMAENLAGGNIAITLLGNTIPTGAILVVLITMLSPISGAHFNPCVTMVFAIKKEITLKNGIIYCLMQILGGILGVYAAHVMFDQTIMQWSTKLRTGQGQWFAETVATFGLIFTILATLKADKNRMKGGQSKTQTGHSSVPMAVGLYITAAYWFTASTSFANPAVTIARSLSNSFAGIAINNVPGFIIAQLIGALLALAVCQWLLSPKQTNSTKLISPINKTIPQRTNVS